MKETENIGRWVVMIKLKANISSTGTGLPTGTELVNIQSALLFLNRQFLLYRKLPHQKIG